MLTTNSLNNYYINDCINVALWLHASKFQVKWVYFLAADKAVPVEPGPHEY